MNVYHNSLCLNHSLVYRCRNAHCTKRLILIRIVIPLTSKMIIVTMHSLLDTINASMHACFLFSSLISFKFSYLCTTLHIHIYFG